MSCKDGNSLALGKKQSQNNPARDQWPLEKVKGIHFNKSFLFCRTKQKCRHNNGRQSTVHLQSLHSAKAKKG